jgi:phosphoribosylaminoimidazole-succinocarboxamide synthase
MKRKKSSEALQENFEKGPLLYEGKAKKVYTIKGDDQHLWFEFKDDLTAFNAQKRGSFASKGATNRDIAALVFRYLRKHDVKSHFVRDLETNIMICEKLEMIPLEVVVRNKVSGSFAKKFNMEEGGEIPGGLVEFFYKDDALQDPFVSDEQALFLRAARDQRELEQLKRAGLQVNRELIDFFLALNIDLIDFKIEFGRNSEGDAVLGDEITPDSCRLWDRTSGERLDKDRFRRDLGGVAEGYAEVLKRMREVWGKKV